MFVEQGPAFRGTGFNDKAPGMEEKLRSKFSCGWGWTPSARQKQVSTAQVQSAPMMRFCSRFRM